MYWLSGISLVAFWLLIGWFVVRTWRSWWRSDVRRSAARWQAGISVFGFASSNASLAIVMLIMVQGFIGSGYVLDRPLGIFALWVACVSALVGIFAAFGGKGRLGFPTAICSAGCLLALVGHWLGR
jgi:hypothetical protein